MTTLREIIRKIDESSQKIDGIFEAAYDSMIQSMIKKYPDHKSSIEWAKNLKKQDRVVWYLKKLQQFIANPNDSNILQSRSIQEFQEKLWHYIGQENIPTIQNYQFRDQQANQLFADLETIEKKFHANRQSQGAFYQDEGDTVLLTFNDGSQWVKLNRAYCEKEATSGKHCGNVVGRTKTDQRILSYRRRDHTVILTFILEPDGTLGEMKGVANTKPQEKYHPAIVQLLVQSYIKGITGQGYLADQNFSVFDLSEENLKFIENKKPKLIIDQINITPTEILTAPDWIKNNPNYNKNIRNPKILSLIRNNSLDNWERAVIGSDLILYAPDNLKNYRQRLFEFLIKKDEPKYLLKVRKKHRLDFDFLKDLLEKRPRYLAAIPSNTRGYVELCEIAVRQDRRALVYVPEELRTPKLYEIAVREDGWALGHVPEELLTPELCEIAVRQSGGALVYVPRNLRTPKLCEIAVRKNGRALQYVPENLRTLEMCRLAMQNALDHDDDNMINTIIDIIPKQFQDTINQEFNLNLNESRQSRNMIESSDSNYEYLPPGVGVSRYHRPKTTRPKFIWKRANQLGNISITHQKLLNLGFKYSEQYNSYGGTESMWKELFGIKETNDPKFMNQDTQIPMETMLPKNAFAGTGAPHYHKLGPAAQAKGKQKGPVRRGQLVGGAEESIEKKKSKQVPLGETVELIISKLIDRIIVNEAIQNNHRKHR